MAILLFKWTNVYGLLTVGVYESAEFKGELKCKKQKNTY